MPIATVYRALEAMRREVRLGLNAGSHESPGEAVLLFVALVLAAGAAASFAGIAVYKVTTGRVATLASVVCAVLGVALAAEATAAIRGFGRRNSAPQKPSSDLANNLLDTQRAAAPRVVFGVLFGAAAEGAIVATLLSHTLATPKAWFMADADAGGFLVLPLAIVLGAGIGLTCGLRSVRLRYHFLTGISAGARERGGVAAVLYLALLAAGATLAWSLGLHVARTKPIELAVVVAASTGILAAISSGFFTAALMAVLGPPRIRRASRLTVAAQSGTSMIVVVAALFMTLPAVDAVTPAALVIGVMSGPWLAARLGWSLPWTRGRMVAGAAAACVATACSALALDHLPDAARSGVLSRAPYAALVVSALRRPFDADHDGYARVLGGGDCNDHDPKVHPGARDVPANGVDENCSGNDAPVYHPTSPGIARSPDEAPLRYNVVLVHLDALRPDHLGFNGYFRPTSPRLDRFRQGATLFSNAYTPAPATRLAVSMLFTGREMERVPHSRANGDTFFLDEGTPTLASRLGAIGYDRVGFTITYMLHRVFRIGQGFRVWTTPWPPNDDEEVSYATSAEQTTDSALRFLKGAPADGTKPYLLFLHYQATHDPYLDHSPWHYGGTAVDYYDSALNYQDDQLGRLFDALDARADHDRTVVVLYSDHGELFGEHGYRRHGYTMYQPDIRTLLLVRVPGPHVPTVLAPVTLTDVYPTLLHLTGLPVDPECQAWDLVPYLRGASPAPRPLFFYADEWRSGIHYVKRAVLDADGRTKFVRNVTNRTTALRDLVADPDEMVNLVDQRPDDARRLADLLDGWEGFENADNKSFERLNVEQEDKQRNAPMPVFLPDPL